MSEKKTSKSKPQKPVKVMTIQAKYEFTDPELVILSREQQTAMQEIDALDAKLKSVKSEYKAKTETIQVRVDLLGSKITAGFEMRETDAVVEYGVPEKRRKSFWKHDPSAPGEKGEFICDEEMMSTDYQIPLLEDKKKDAPLNPVVDLPTAEAVKEALQRDAEKAADEEADRALNSLND